MLNTLNVAQSGLSVANTQVENVMNNIANENTPGYKKRVVGVGESDFSDSRETGRGAFVGGIDRITNVYMYDNLMKQKSKDNQYTELSSMLSDIESIFYETENSGFSNDMDRYFQSIEDLRANPYNEIYISNVTNQGKILVDDLQTLYKGIEDREYVTKNFVDDNVSEINGILNDIGSVNEQISNAINPSNELLDRRDYLETRLSEYMPVDVDRTDNQYSLKIGGAVAVRYNTNIHAIDIKNNNITQKDIYADTTDTSTLVSPTWDGTDTITYNFDKDYSVTVTAGEIVNGLVVDKTNVVQALSFKINNHPKIANKIQAHNGQYTLDTSGNKIEQVPTNVDHYLMIESKVAGTNGKFESKIVINDNDVSDSNGNQISNISEKNSIKSIDAANDIHLEIFEQELFINGGKMKSMLDNINTKSDENKFTKYKKMLDNFAKALSNMSEAYINTEEGNYVSGKNDSELNKDKANMKNIGLFDGASVNTLSFNSSVVANLLQEDLDYLATIQWNENINIEGDDRTSFSKYLQKIKVSISADKENVDYIKETQTSVTKSLEASYDKLTKVNKDDEMINLIKFQAAYEANAKLITIVDEMLATILGMKR